MIDAVYLHPPGIVSALGSGREATAAALFDHEIPHGVAADAGIMPGRVLHTGRVHAALPALDHLPLPLRSRNNALLAAALAQIRTDVDAAIARHGAGRVAIVLGTSTSGIGESEAATLALAAGGDAPAGFHYGQQEMGSPALFLRHLLGTSGPAYVVSTACSSSAKAIVAGARLLRAGLADAVIVGGADSLCRFTVAGFAALESIDAARCNPCSRNRRGINIGEAAALFVIDREPAAVRLAGWGESSDAHHMSAPDPSGRGALAAMQAALQRAGIAADALDYVNLHGTATPLNDAMEAAALHALGAAAVPASSTKPLTGHTLGAAGALEAALGWLVLAGNPGRQLPRHWWDGDADPALAPLRLVPAGMHAARAPRHVLSNSFAFGGSNASLLLSLE
jgi:3-oxoacyl-[acyl-carrier-protein] synthase-1